MLKLHLKIATCAFILVCAAERTENKTCTYGQKRTFSKSITVPDRSCQKFKPAARVLGRSNKRAEKERAKDVITVYPGLFLYKKNVATIQKSLTSKKTARKQRRTGDGDIHCPTIRTLKQAPFFKKNVFNVMKELVHFKTEGVFQYYHKGACGPRRTWYCKRGQCVQEYSVVYLLVWADDPQWPFSFDPFEVESYCSCRRIA